MKQRRFILVTFDYDFIFVTFGTELVHLQFTVATDLRREKKWQKVQSTYS